MRLQPLVLLVLFCLSAKAETNLFGVQVGVTLGGSTAGSEGTPGTASNRTSGSIGVLYEWELNDLFYFSPELNFSGRGGSTNSFDEIELPLILTAKFGTEELKALLSGGVNFGLVVSKATSFGAGNEGTLDFGICFGAGIEYKLSKFTLFFSGRFITGLSDMDTRATTFGRNSGMEVRLGTKFAL